MSHLGGGSGRGTVAYRVQEFAHVFGVAVLAAQFLAFGWSGRSLGPRKTLKAPRARRSCTLGAVKDVAVVESM